MSSRKVNFRTRRTITPGASPGTLTAHPDAHPPEIRVIGYGPETSLDESGVGAEAAAGFLNRHPVTWINVDGLGDPNALDALGRTFDLHLLALEDVINLGQRPKVEEYEDHLFIVLGMPVGQSTRIEQLSLFLIEGILVSFQEHPGDCLEPVRKRIQQGRTRIRSSGADYLAYAIIDTVIDSFFPVLESYGERLLEMESKLLAGKDVPVALLHDIKRDLLALRGYIRPLRDVTTSLLRVDTDLISEKTRLFFRDCNDHSMQLIDLVEGHRDLSSSLVELYRANMSNRMNEVMKVLTIIATIFIPITFVAGIYGMNFNSEISRWNMPELNWVLGYPAALGIMALVVLAMLLFFRKKSWL